MSWDKALKTVRQPEDMEDEKTCALCGKPYKGFGNNGRPLIDGRVCDECNRFVVLYRLKMVQDKLPKMKKPSFVSDPKSDADAQFFDSSWQNSLRQEER
jgi:hypothetical protein